MMSGLRYTFVTLVLIGLTLVLSSWDDEERRVSIEPLRPGRAYAEPSQ